MKKEKAFQTEGGAWTMRQGEKGQGIAQRDSSILIEKAEGEGQRDGADHMQHFRPQRGFQTLFCEHWEGWHD